MSLQKFKVEVCRIGHGLTTLEVEAQDAKEAAMLASERAGDVCFSEHSSEYEVNHVIDMATGRMVEIEPASPLQKFTAFVRIHETEKALALQVECLPNQPAVIAAIEQAIVQDMLDDGYEAEDATVEAVRERGYDLNAVIEGHHQRVFDSLSFDASEAPAATSKPVASTEMVCLRQCIEHVLAVSEDGDIDDIDLQMLRDALSGSVMPPETSVEVKHWDAYHTPGTVLTHQFDLLDRRAIDGQAIMTVGTPIGIDDYLSVAMGVGTNPQDSDDDVPSALVYFDADNIALSLFKVGKSLVMRPEPGVTINPFHQDEELLYSIE